MKLFGTQKDKTGRRIYFFGVKVYEKTKSNHTQKTYILGIRFRKKRKQSSTPPADYSTKLKQIEWRAKLHAAEEKILLLGLHYKNLPCEQKYVLCFDCLYEPYAEAIDAWTMFQFLQNKGIPSKYVLLKKNPLSNGLMQEGKMKDVILVNDELSLLYDYPEIIAKSHTLLSSFGFRISKIFKILPTIRDIFIEHGVMLLKTAAVAHYNEDSPYGCSETLVPTRLTKDMYDSMQIWQDKMLCCGLPRWDNLPIGSSNGQQKKIFIFFTFRSSFARDTAARNEYLKRIQIFIDHITQLAAKHAGTEVYISLHHSLIQQNEEMRAIKFNGAIPVQHDQVSKMIKETDLFVTDYSSMAFDFMYRDVPTVFYCFDHDIQYCDHRDRPADAAARIEELLGDCALDIDSAIEKIDTYLRAGCKLREKEIARNKAIFWFRGHNCESLFNLLSR